MQSVNLYKPPGTAHTSALVCSKSVAEGSTLGHCWRRRLGWLSLLPHMSYIVWTPQEAVYENYIGDYYRGYLEGYRSLDYSSHAFQNNSSHPKQQQPAAEAPHILGTSHERAFAEYGCSQKLVHSRLSRFYLVFMCPETCRGQSCMGRYGEFPEMAGPNSGPKGYDTLSSSQREASIFGNPRLGDSKIMAFVSHHPCCILWPQLSTGAGAGTASPGGLPK